MLDLKKQKIQTVWLMEHVSYHSFGLIMVLEHYLYTEMSPYLRYNDYGSVLNRTMKFERKISG